MKPMRAMSAITAALAIVVLSATQAFALWSPTYSKDQVRITACNWNWKAGSKGDTTDPVYIRVGGNPWAAASRAPDNGAGQNFSILAQDGVGQWNGITSNANYRLGMTYSTSTTGADIRLYQGMPSNVDSSFAGITYVQTEGRSSPGPDACPEVSLTNLNWSPVSIVKVNTYTKVRDGWFTQYGNDQWGRDVRKEWEKCWEKPPTNDPRLNDYTCKKDLDFGSVITHELGHAIGMTHPNPDKESNTSRPALAARCGYVKEQATMCFYVLPGRTAQRTPEVADADAFSYGQTVK